MGTLNRLAKFSAGAMVGSVAGVATGLLWAPGSGTEFKNEIRARIAEAKIAGLEAQLRTELRLIQRFRSDVNDPKVLADLEFETIQSTTGKAVAAKDSSPIPLKS
jgi:gas vesicle protein